jgi:uncharacterized protein
MTEQIASAAGGVSSAGEETRVVTQITDPHMHIGEFEAFDVRLHPDALAAYLAEYGIDTGVVFCPDNALVQRTVARVPAAYGLYWANPKNPDAVREAAAYLDDPRFRGIKLHPYLDGYSAGDQIVWPLIELIAERGLPALIHCGHDVFASPWAIEVLAQRYPQAKLILGHMGHGHIAYINGSIEVASRNPNVWLETSGMPMGSKITAAVRQLGASRVMYGSDAPFHDPSVEQFKVIRAVPDETERNVVMHHAAQSLFFGKGEEE